jgi:hypothetical protein
MVGINGVELPDRTRDADHLKRRPWMPCSVAVELVGQTSSLTSEANDNGSSAGVEAVAKAV